MIPPWVWAVWWGVLAILCLWLGWQLREMGRRHRRDTTRWQREIDQLAKRRRERDEP